MPPKKRARTDQGSSGQQQTEEEEREREAEVSLLRDRLSAVVAGHVENVRKRAQEEGDRLLTDATEAAAKVLTTATEAADRVMKELNDAKEAADRVSREAKEAAARVMQDATDSTDAAGKLIEDEIEAAKAEAAEKSRRDREEREALEQNEKTAMEKAFTFQKNRIILNVGGQRFETSRQTLTSVPDTYLASMFSGNFELAPDVDDGSYFIDRNPKHFSLILDYLRDSGSNSTASAVAGAMGDHQREELKIELKFYGLLDRMLPPYYEQDQIGRNLLRRACSGAAGTIKKEHIQTAVAQARALIFTIGSTTPFLREKYQDLRFFITGRVVNRSPVWAAVDGVTFMYRDEDGDMWISDEERCAKGLSQGCMYHFKASEHVRAPTELPSDRWRSNAGATLELQYASAEQLPDANGDLVWARVPEMRITAVHGLDDDDPAMAAALKQLATALPQ